MRIDAYTIIGEASEGGLNPEELIDQMEAAHVTKWVIAPVERCLAVANREGNEYMITVAKEYPKKFIPTCTANPWYREEAIAGIRHFIEKGAKIVVFAPHLQGYILNDGTVFPLLEALEEQALPVYVHTGHYEHATPWQLAELALRYPAINFIMGHCGSTDFKPDAVTAAERCPNIYLESSLVKSFVFKSMLETIGAQRGIMGSSAPLSGLEFEWKQMEECLPFKEYKNLYGKNLQMLLSEGE